MKIVYVVIMNDTDQLDIDSYPATEDDLDNGITYKGSYLPAWSLFRNFWDAFFLLGSLAEDIGCEVAQPFQTINMRSTTGAHMVMH